MDGTLLKRFPCVCDADFLNIPAFDNGYIIKIIKIKA